MSHVMDNGLSRDYENGANSREREFVSGELVEPGVYIDVENGAIVRVVQTDELPDGRVVMRYRRRFRRSA